MNTYTFEMETEKEQNLFFSLCSQEDKQKLTGELPMTYPDFLRICCILFHLNLAFYETYVYELFPEFYRKKEHMMTRHNDILLEYPDYYKDECFEEKMKTWLIQFCEQIKDTAMRDACRKKLDIDFEENGKSAIP